MILDAMTILLTTINNKSNDNNDINNNNNNNNNNSTINNVDDAGDRLLRTLPQWLSRIESKSAIKVGNLCLFVCY
jgi:hypothetical protein